MHLRIASSVFLLLLTSFAAAEEGAKLEIETVKAGDCSRVAKKGDVLQMHYKGTLTDGSEFDSSYDRGEPFSFTLGKGMVIQGWDQGLDGICKGEVRNLVVPPHMGYGEKGFPPVIPENAVLNFKVELVEFGEAGEDDDYDDEYDDEDDEDYDEDGEGDDDDDDDDDEEEEEEEEEKRDEL